VIAIGAAEEGLDTLRALIESLPADAPGVVVAAHGPLELCGRANVEIKEAAYGDVVLPGRVLVSPPDHHILVRRCGTRLYVQVTNGPLAAADPHPGTAVTPARAAVALRDHHAGAPDLFLVQEIGLPLVEAGADQARARLHFQRRRIRVAFEDAQERGALELDGAVVA